MPYMNSVNPNNTSGFPYLIMDINRGRSIPEPPGFHVFHWHEDFQFILCYEGETYVHTLNHTYVLKASQGIFLNSSVVHFVAGSPDHHYKSFLFPESLVSFYAGSPAAGYVKQISECKSLAAIPLSSEADWMKKILEKLKSLACLEDDPPSYYEYEILVRLSEIFLILIANTELPNIEKKDINSLRMQEMLRFIRDHYMDPVSLSDLAGAAGISRSEASRCFKASLQQSPYNYLLEYRLSKAAQLLASTDDPISKICADTGWSSMSHFGKLFKASTGLTPREYRAMRKHNKYPVSKP